LSLFLKKEWILPVEISRGMLKKIFNFSWPAIPGGIAGYIVNWIDVIVIKMYLDMTLVGLYSVAYGIYNYLMAVPLMGINLVSLVLTAFLVRKREDLIAVYVKRFIPQAIFLWSFFVSIIMIISGSLFDIWVGPQYRSAVPPFIVLAIGLIFRSITCAYAPIYTAYIMPKRYHLTNIFIALLNLTADLILIPRYGIMGAAIATTSAFFVSSILLLLMANYKLKIVQLSPLLYSIPAVLCGLISLFIDNFQGRLIFFVLIFSITVIIARKNRLIERKDAVILESIKMPPGLKRFITKFIYVFAFE
jgi:O-antigen/teichoic acid export membrane protein